MLTRVLVHKVSGDQIVMMKKGYSIHEFLVELMPHHFDASRDKIARFERWLNDYNIDTRGKKC